MSKDPDILVDLTSGRTDFEAEVIVNALQEQGIFAQAFTAAGAMMPWHIAATQPMRVQVRRADLDRAQIALQSIRSDSIDLEWSEVDTGDRTPLTEEERKFPGQRTTCAGCGYELTGILKRTRRCPECGRSIDRLGDSMSHGLSISRRLVVWLLLLVVVLPFVATIVWRFLIW